MSGYVFLSNSNKPSETEADNREKVTLGNVSKPWIETALELGYEVWLGINRNNPEELECNLPIHLYDSHTYRSIFNLKDNFIAYKNLNKILKQNQIEIIHCNTPVGGIIGRICGKKQQIRKIIYTAHGFHFYKGAPLLNRTILKWAEMIMAHWTDAIITMNQEDYEAAKKFKLRKGGKVYYIPGVGISTQDYLNTKKDERLRESLNIKKEDIVCISVGNLVKGKNYKTAIHAIFQCHNPKIKYLICGKGPELGKLQQLVRKLNIEEQVKFLGFRSDIKELLKISDIFLFTTFREGMPRAMMEAMASGLPCIVSKIRGNIDLLEDGKGGYLVAPTDILGISKRILRLSKQEKERLVMGENNLERIKRFDVNIVEKKAKEIYKDILG